MVIVTLSTKEWMQLDLMSMSWTLLSLVLVTFLNLFWCFLLNIFFFKVQTTIDYFFNFFLIITDKQITCSIHYKITEKVQQNRNTESWRKAGVKQDANNYDYYNILGDFNTFSREFFLLFWRSGLGTGNSNFYIFCKRNPFFWCHPLCILDFIGRKSKIWCRGLS